MQKIGCCNLYVIALFSMEDLGLGKEISHVTWHVRGIDALRPRMHDFLGAESDSDEA